MKKISKKSGDNGTAPKVTPTPPPSPPKANVEIINAPEVINVDKVIDFDGLKDNSVIILRFGQQTDKVYQTIQVLASRYGKQLKEKNVSVIAMSPNDSIELLNESEMNGLGWEKKSKSRIIT